MKLLKTIKWYEQIIVLIFLIGCTWMNLSGTDVKEPAGDLQGQLLDKTNNQPIENAEIHLKHVYNNNVFKTGPTTAQGKFSLAKIPQGPYLVGLTINNRPFNASDFIAINKNQTTQIKIAVNPAQNTAQANQDFVTTPPAKKSFFKTPFGIATIISGAVLTTYGIYEIVNKKEDKEVSPTSRSKTN